MHEITAAEIKCLLNEIEKEKKNYFLWKELLFQFDPEWIHHTVLSLAKLAPQVIAKIFSPHVASVVKKNFISPHMIGFKYSWRNLLGLAAGLDKNADALELWDALGFGAIEIGSVTLKPQAGNPKPRILRLVEEQSLLNWMGFPSKGAHYVLTKLAQFRRRYPESKLHLSINLGKNLATPIVQATDEYSAMINIFAQTAHSFVINISSPNTSGLRQLQQHDYLVELLEKVAKTRNEVAPHTPLLLKVSPDEPLDFYHQLPGLLLQYQWQGLVLFNTSIHHQHGKGGVSGKKLEIHIKRRGLDLVVNHLKEKYHSNLCIISRFGMTHKTKTNGPLQCYTDFVYQGPGVYQYLYQSH